MTFKRRILSLIVALAVLISLPGWADPTREYEIKAAFVYNFALFIDWPPGSFKDNTVVFGVLGKDVYGGALQELTKHNVGDNHIVVKNLASLDEAGDCQVLIVSPSEESHYPQIFNAVRGKSVLTVGETPDFAARGGCVGFVVYRSRLRFEINTEALKRENLKASSKLLNLATIVSDRSGSAPAP